MQFTACYIPDTYNIIYNISTKTQLSKSTSIDCAKFKMTGVYLLCIGVSEVLIYDTSVGFLPAPFHFNSSTIANVGDLAIIDAAMSLSEYRITLYIADLALGFLEISIASFTSSVYNASIFGDSKDVVSVFATQSLFYWLKANGSVVFYSISFFYTPRFIKLIESRGVPISFSSSSSILALQYLNSTVVLDLYSDTYSAYYATIPTDITCSLATPDVEFELDIMVYVNCLDQSYITAYTFPSTKQVFDSPIDTYMTFNVSCLVQSYIGLYTIGKLTAFNELGSNTLVVAVSVANYQMTIKGEGFSHTNSTELAYNMHETFALSSLFLGQDLEFSLYINGIYANSNDDFSNPATLVTKQGLTYYEHLEGVEFYNMGFSEAGKIVVSATSKGFLVKDLILQSVSLTSYSMLKTPGVECLQVTDMGRVDDVVYLAAFCNYNETDKYLSFSQNLTRSAYYLLEFNTTIRAFNLGGLVMMESVYEVVGLTSQLLRDNCTMFVSLTENYSGAYYNNNLLLAKGCVYPFKYSQSVEDYITLGLDSLSVSAVAVLQVEGKILLYVADSLSGLRIFDATNVTQIVLLESYLFKPTLVSIGICDGWLFLGDTTESVYKYTIANPLKPVFMEKAYKTGKMKGIRGIIQCSAKFDPQFVTVPMEVAATGSFVLRVFDLFDPDGFNLFCDISLNDTGPALYPGSYTFTSSPSIIATGGSSYYEYKMHSPQLVYQSMTKTQFQMMLEKWKTNMFAIYFNVTSNQQYVASNQIYLQRTGPDCDDDTDDSSVVLALGLGLLLV